jgi:hypothetical protein
MGTMLRRVLPAIVVAAVLVTGAAALAGGCKQVIGWQQATLLDAGTIGACTPGTMIQCHTGPAGTEVLGETVGICNAGNAKCNEDGTGYGACEGEGDVPKGVPCSRGDAAAGVCNGTGTCVECNKGTDCATGVCTNAMCCVPTTCAALGKTCGMAPDGCLGMLDCNDNIKDGTETDVDCGGANCPQCANGKTCDVGTDCAGGTCASGTCCTLQSCTTLGLTCGMATDGCGGTLNCNDGVKDGTETDVDCGGPGMPDAGVPPCPPCGLGLACNLSTDCQSMVCANNVCCNMPCNLCYQCTPAGFVTAGTCNPISMGATDGICSHMNLEACDGQGNCLGTAGHQCTSDSDCLSTYHCLTTHVCE